MKKNFQVTIDPMTYKKDIKEAKLIIKALKTEPNGTSSALACMELDTFNLYHVTTYSKKSGELKRLKRPCDLKRITPLQIEVKVQYGRASLEVSWDAEGSIEDKPCYAKIHAFATWENGWYSWVYAEDDGTPAAPLATIYISEENI